MDSIVGGWGRSLLTPDVQKSDIVVTSASGVLADQVAEHTLALLGALFRGLPTFIMLN